MTFNTQDEVDMSGVIKFTEDMKEMGALCKLTWSGDQYILMDGEYGWKDAPPVTLDTAMTEADFSNKHLGVSGAIILAAVLGCKTFRDSGSLVSLNLAQNGITYSDISGVDGAKHVAEMLPKW